jgi:hypothetical protein
MLAFDIETLGFLSTKPLPPITCVCLYDGSREDRLLFFKVSDSEFEKNKAVLMERLDSASCLAGFNAVHFDLEYIRQFFGVDAPRMNAWVLKCKDPFMVAKYILKNTCGLNHLLSLNELGSKTGCGGNAITLANEEKWDMLLDYCMMDARLTYDLCERPLMFFSKYLTATAVDGLWRFTLQTQATAAAPPNLPTLEHASVLSFYEDYDSSESPAAQAVQ